jgi:hypothetical protein
MWKKILLLIPFVGIISLGELFGATKIDEELSYILWNSIFGSLSEGDIATIVLSMKTISSISLFVLLYGNYIAEYFTDVANIYFVRVQSRKVWTARKGMELIAYAFFYSLLFIVLQTIVCSLRVENLVIDRVLVQTVLIIAGVLAPVLVALTILVNGIATKWGISVGVLVAVVLTVGLEVVAIIGYNRWENIVLNPLCFNIYLLEDRLSILYKIITNFIYVGISFGGLILYLDRLDIWGKEN